MFSPFPTTSPSRALRRTTPTSTSRSHPEEQGTSTCRIVADPRPYRHSIRLWSSRPKKSFDLQAFNAGDYDAAVKEASQAENISAHHLLLDVEFRRRPVLTFPPRPRSSCSLPERQFRRRQAPPSHPTVLLVLCFAQRHRSPLQEAWKGMSLAFAEILAES